MSPYLDGRENFNPITSFGKEAQNLKWGDHIPQFHSQDKIVFGKTYDTKAQVNVVQHAEPTKTNSFYSSIKGYENRGFPALDNNSTGNRNYVNPIGKTTTHLTDTTFINSRLPRLVGPAVETESPYRGSSWGAYKQRGEIK
jgi:hypothetical protein